VHLVEPRLVQGASAFFEGLLRAAPMTLLVSPSHEALQMLAAAWITPWLEGRTIRVEATDADWNAFARLEVGRPVLFERGTDGRLMLIAGRGIFFLHDGGRDRRARIERAGDSGVDSSAMFEEWLQTKGQSVAVRGVCAATFVRD
jgi:hypothetical protein